MSLVLILPFYASAQVEESSRVDSNAETETLHLLGKGEKGEFKEGESAHFIDELIGFECVGKDSEGNTNCFEIRPFIYNEADQIVIERGNVLKIKHVSSDPIQSEPTKKDIHEFLVQMNHSYFEYSKSHMSKFTRFIDSAIGVVVGAALIALGKKIMLNPHTPASEVMGMFAVAGATEVLLYNWNHGVRTHEEMIDETGYNWSEKAKKFSRKRFKEFRMFIMQYGN